MLRTRGTVRLPFTPTPDTTSFPDLVLLDPELLDFPPPSEVVDIGDLLRLVISFADSLVE